MGMGQSFRKLADRARDKVRPEQGDHGIDQTADKFDEATGDKHASKVDKAQEKARNAARKLLRRDESGG